MLKILHLDFQEKVDVVILSSEMFRNVVLIRQFDFSFFPIGCFLVMTGLDKVWVRFEIGYDRFRGL
jgi:hypothetical protein